MTKRARRGTGHVRQRKDGTWQIDLSIAGKRSSVYGATMAEARAKEARAKAETRLGASGARTLKDWLAEWLAGNRDTLAPQTWLAYEGHVRNHIGPVLGAIRLDRLTPEHMDLLDAAVRRRAPKTASHVRGTLSSALETAKRRRLVTSNVAKAVTAPPRAARVIEVLTREDVNRLLDAAHDDPFEAAYVLAVVLGVREGELLGLRWRHIDLIRGTVRIVSSATRTLEKGGRRELKDPKTSAGTRQIGPIPPVVLDALLRTEHKGDLVWPHPVHGGPIPATTFIARQWEPMRDKAGIPKVNFHVLRHTAATHMLEDGVEADLTAGIVGHASVKTTLGIYAHATKPRMDAAMGTIGARYVPHLRVVENPIDGILDGTENGN